MKLLGGIGYLLYCDSLGSMTRKRVALLPCSSCSRSHESTTFPTTTILLLAARAEPDRKIARGVSWTSDVWRVDSVVMKRAQISTQSPRRPRPARFASFILLLSFSKTLDNGIIHPSIEQWGIGLRPGR